MVIPLQIWDSIDLQLSNKMLIGPTFPRKFSKLPHIYPHYQLKLINKIKKKKHDNDSDNDQGTATASGGLGLKVIDMLEALSLM